MNRDATARPLSSLRPLRNLLLCALPALWLAGCSFTNATAKREVSQTVADAKSLVVTGENGKVELIQDASATTMQVEAVIRCSSDTQAKADARVAAATLTAVKDEGGTVRVSVEFPPRDSAVPSMLIGGSMGSNDDSASIVIRVASLEGIEVSTTNGSIAVGAFRGAAKLSTSNGSIEVKDHAGPIDARSSNGAIRASGVHAPVVADTSNGRIEISLAPDAQGDVTIDTSNGSVLLDLGSAWQGTVTADTSNGKIELSGGDVVTKFGTKTMTIGDAAKAKAVIDTSNGRVTVRVATK